MAISNSITMMKLASDGSCEIWQPSQSNSGTLKISLALAGIGGDASDVVPQLLGEGWIPIRETSFGNGTILIIFEKR